MPTEEFSPGPFVASIPSALQRHINTLQGGYENCGRLSSSLVRLDGAQQKLSDVLQRHVSSLEAELATLQQDVEEDQLRLNAGLIQLSDHLLRLQEDFAHIKQRTKDRISRVATKLQKAQSQDFTAVVDQMQACTTDFTRDIRTAELDLTRVESQLVGLNAWNVAWPEAVTALNNVQPSRVSPPQYSVSGAPRPPPSNAALSEPVAG
ncbi:hypothetical protein CF319_g3684 [Tilletia indica]|uniref:Uncharacterized protein n=1 Tax=Tilletia indica TaxID=43049 RepID=A0A177TC50_9BASI|nr:hypothetical protein CF319_g3684 [Tilletia indica]KAE8230960.1 hypothetical protein CF326_g4034 [Tilletia indica]KAE8244507.1 hypothetical protein A4X13_0g6545 [Tilletia indica]